MDVVRRALEEAGVEFIEENGGGPGVRFAKVRRSALANRANSALMQKIRLI
jgi:hypothetical protein